MADRLMAMALAFLAPLLIAWIWELWNYGY